jgi:hypothetical protein
MIVGNSNDCARSYPTETKPTWRRCCATRVYWHVMPSYKQAKLTAWEMLKHFARPIPSVTFNEAELLVKYPNGSRLQLIGADNPDPVHDFASHAADAFRGFASRYQQPREKLQPRWGSVSTSP